MVKTIKRFIALVLVVMFVFTGCGVNKVTISSGEKVSPEVESTIKKVAGIYGEQNPKIIQIKKTEEETTNKPMYLVFLKGNFKKGEQKSQTLEFSMTVDSRKVWALQADSWQDAEVNISN